MSVTVHMRHLRAAGICNRESRIFCTQQGWSWTEFVTHGLPVEQFEATGNHFALKVARIAREDAADEG